MFNVDRLLLRNSTICKDYQFSKNNHYLTPSSSTNPNNHLDANSAVDAAPNATIKATVNAIVNITVNTAINTINTILDADASEFLNSRAFDLDNDLNNTSYIDIYSLIQS
jgi:hypothetical protein